MVYPGKPQLPRGSALSCASWSSCAGTKIIGTRLCEAANCVDRNGNFFEKGAQESAFFGDASDGLDSRCGHRGCLYRDEPKSIRCLPEERKKMRGEALSRPPNWQALHTPPRRSAVGIVSNYRHHFCVLICS